MQNSTKVDSIRLLLTAARCPPTRAVVPQSLLNDIFEAKVPILSYIMQKFLAGSSRGTKAQGLFRRSRFLSLAFTEQNHCTTKLIKSIAKKEHRFFFSRFAQIWLYFKLAITDSFRFMDTDYSKPAPLLHAKKRQQNQGLALFAAFSFH